MSLLGYDFGKNRTDFARLEGILSAIPERPAYGLCLPCRVMGVISADHLLIHLPKHFEIELILIDCVAPATSLPSDQPGVAGLINPAAAEARDEATAMIAAHKTVAAWIPQPSRDEGWVRHFQPGKRHAGFLYLGEERKTLNERLVDGGHCRRPRRSWSALTPT